MGDTSGLSSTCNDSVGLPSHQSVYVCETQVSATITIVCIHLLPFYNGECRVDISYIVPAGVGVCCVKNSVKNEIEGIQLCSQMEPSLVVPFKRWQCAYTEATGSRAYPCHRPSGPLHGLERGPTVLLRTLPRRIDTVYILRDAHSLSPWR